MGIVQISLKSNRICLRYNDLSDRRIRSCARPKDGRLVFPLPRIPSLCMRIGQSKFFFHPVARILGLIIIAGKDKPSPAPGILLPTSGRSLKDFGIAHRTVLGSCLLPAISPWPQMAVSPDR